LRKSYDEYYGSDADNEIESLILTDGTTYNLKAALTFTGTANAETVNGTVLADTLRGMAGDDYLYGQGGNDTLDGGSGNDSLNGDTGNDTYLFSSGFGQDVIYDGAGSADVIRLGTGITASMLRFERSGNDLVVHVGTAGDKITLNGQFYGEYYGYNYDNEVESLILADGTNYNLKGTLIYTGTSSADYMTGTNLGDNLRGVAGDDYLYAQGGNDTLDGGTGNDSLNGDTGNDTYLFNAGFGQDVIYDGAGSADVIRLGTGITASMLRFEKSGNDLVVHVGTAGNKITINGQFYDEYYGSNVDNEIESLILADGTSYNLKGTLIYTGTSSADNMTGTNLSDNMRGVAGDDYLYAQGGNDILRGGDGHDYLSGGSGNDQLYGENGFDQLWGDAGADLFAFGKLTALNGMDTIHDFSRAEGDRIDLSDILEAYDPLTMAIADYLRVTDDGSNTTIAVDPDGGRNSFTQITTLNNISDWTNNTTATDAELRNLITNGSLII
jgi:Ca2+-binding RTX toxin-like protein